MLIRFARQEQREFFASIQLPRVGQGYLQRRALPGKRHYCVLVSQTCRYLPGQLAREAD